MEEIDPVRLPELYEALRQIPVSSDLAEVVEATLKTAVKLLSAEQAFARIDNSYYPVLYSLPQLDSKIEPPISRSLDALLNEIERTRQSILIADSQGDPRFAAEPSSTFFASRSLLIIPLQTPKDFLGILIVDRAISADTFTPNDLATLEFFVKWATMMIQAAQIAKVGAEFVPNVANELQTPLTSIKGFTDILQKELAGPLTETQKDFLSRIFYNVIKASGLIHAEVQVNRIKIKRIRLELKPVNLKEQVEYAANNLQISIQKKRHTVTLNLENIQPVRVDRSYLLQIIDILFDNAIKYTTTGGAINITSEIQDSFVRLSIADNGVGIPQDEQSRIFREFSRGSNAYQQTEGFGLNLYIAKNLIELMGGQIGFTSEENKGSTFWFTLPIAKEEIPTTN